MNVYNRNRRINDVLLLTSLVSGLACCIAVISMAPSYFENSDFLRKYPECFSGYSCAPSSTNQTIIQFCKTMVCNIYQKNITLLNEGAVLASITYVVSFTPVLYLMFKARNNAQHHQEALPTQAAPASTASTPLLLADAMRSSHNVTGPTGSINRF